ncbi:hypothetical protein P4H71_14425 [Paenibacillus kribbensis]|uniref:hypothetical protein n=1 Tax=Paenibacillus kribbensis TaxID=172713 RepID=UPI002DBCE17C|nr:hypothetical protein [Paenibacillus kribbensis]MEC0235523.1 hypothetical protein [Paenibacillus kribbensis]
MYTIGVVGPKPSIDRIIEVGREYADTAKLIPYPYENLVEAAAIIPAHRGEVSGWLFTGPIPYMAVKPQLKDSDSIVYCSPTGASLYKGILHLLKDTSPAIKRISLDMVELEEFNLQESLDELELPESMFAIHMFEIKQEGHRDKQQETELADAHIKMWESGQTQAALTCMHAVHKRLLERGVPCSKIDVTRMEIRQALRISIEKQRASYFKDSQIGVQIIEIENLDKVSGRSGAKYYVQLLELEIKRVLLEFCDKLDGSLLENGNGRYQIFGSRGAMEREIAALREAVFRLETEVDQPVAVGIGFGETALSAEQHARKAIQTAKDREVSDIIIVRADGTVVESAGGQDELEYEYRTEDRELLDRLNQAAVSIRTYRKIEALARRKGWGSFSASDLAADLSMTVRNAQRIMLGLVENGLALATGGELQTSRGRPRKIYQLKR